MEPIPFPISSTPGAKPQEGAGRLINCFAEKTEVGSPFPVIWRRSPGLIELTDILSFSHYRGGIVSGSTLIAVFDTRAYAITSGSGAYSFTNLGSFLGSDKITVALNNKTPTPDIVAVSSAGVFNLSTGSAPTAFADADLPSPNSVSQLDGYFLFTIGDGRIFASDLNGVSIATNSFTTAQRRPGGLLRGVAFRAQFFAFGPAGTEVYDDRGEQPFPLTYTTFVPRGIIGTHAVAGWEEGWANQLIWVGDDYNVYRMDVYTPTPIGTPDVSRDIAKAAKDGLGALLEASVYIAGNNAFWQITNPGEWTWEYNATTGNWNERISYGRSDWRASGTIKAFNQWVCGERATGKLYGIDAGSYLEGTNPLSFVMRSGRLAKEGRYNAARLELATTSAVGDATGLDPIQTDPVGLVRWSHDGGVNFKNPVARELGPQGEGHKRLIVHRLGLCDPRGLVIELEVADPVHVACMGGGVELVPLAP